MHRSLRWIVLMPLAFAVVFCIPTGNACHADDDGLPLIAEMGLPPSELELLFDTFMFDDRSPDPEASTRFRMEFFRHRRLQRIQSVCDLKDEDLKRFELASRGDVFRLFERVQQQREQYVQISQGKRKPVGDNTRRELLELRDAIRREKSDDGPLFQKLYQTTLTQHQQFLVLSSERKFLIGEAESVMAGRGVTVEWVILIVDPRLPARPGVKLTDVMTGKIPIVYGYSSRVETPRVSKIAGLSSRTLKIKTPEDFQEAIGHQGISAIVSSSAALTNEGRCESMFAVSPSKDEAAPRTVVGWEMTPAVFLSGEINLRLAFEVGSYTRRRKTEDRVSITRLAAEEIDLTARPGQSIVLRGIALPSTDTNRAVAGTSQPVQKENSAPDPAARELILILTPRLGSARQ